jgi:hypothetical protein
MPLQPGVDLFLRQANKTRIKTADGARNSKLAGFGGREL